MLEIRDSSERFSGGVLQLSDSVALCHNVAEESFVAQCLIPMRCKRLTYG